MNKFVYDVMSSDARCSKLVIQSASCDLCKSPTYILQKKAALSISSDSISSCAFSGADVMLILILFP